VLFTSRAPARALLSGVVALAAVATLSAPALAAPAVHAGIVPATVSSASGGTPAAAPDDRNRVLVSISAPQTAHAGEAAKFGVTVKDFDDGTPLAGAVVVLLRRAAGEGGWAEADRTQTDANGHAVLSAAVRPPATDFRARVPGSDDHRHGLSARITVTTDG
jgi:hypothetical protein